MSPPAMSPPAMNLNWELAMLTMLQELAGSHITREDILKIGRALIGLRHVSSEKAAQENAEQGFLGCSFNISFVGAEDSPDATFEDLDLKLRLGDDCQDLIESYEKAISGFIRTSIFMDADGPKTYRDLFAVIEKTRFMLVKQNRLKSADSLNSSWGGLGRFSEEPIDASGVLRLPSLTEEELNVDETLLAQPFPHYSEDKRIGEQAINYLVSHYRKKLLDFLRSEDFKPTEFNQSLSSKYLVEDDTITRLSDAERRLLYRV